MYNMLGAQSGGAAVVATCGRCGRGHRDCHFCQQRISCHLSHCWFRVPRRTPSDNVQTTIWEADVSTRVPEFLCGSAVSKMEEGRSAASSPSQPIPCARTTVSSGLMRSSPTLTILPMKQQPVPHHFRVGVPRRDHPCACFKLSPQETSNHRQHRHLSLRGNRSTHVCVCEAYLSVWGSDSRITWQPLWRIFDTDTSAL